MISTSAEFTTEANRKVNRIPRAKVEILWTDPFVGSANTVTSTDVNNFGNLDTDVSDDFNEHVFDTKVITPHKWAVTNFAETSASVTSDSWYSMPGSIFSAANNQVGWYSESVSDSSGDFASPPEITVNFGEDRAIQVIRIVGEPTIGEYPEEYDVAIYDSGDVELFSESVTGNTSVESTVDASASSITDARYMTLTINKWSESGSISKIVEFFGVITDTFYQDDIVSIDVLEEMESKSGTTPIGNVSINELTLELQNIKITHDSTSYADPFLPDNSSSYLTNAITPNVRITPYLGFRLNDSGLTTEYVKMGVFWSTEWEVSETEFSAVVVARDRMELLRENEFQQDKILEGYTLYEVAEYVLNHAKANIPLNDLTWDISSNLDVHTVGYVYFGKVTYFEALSKIATAAMGRVFVNRDDEIVIQGFQSDAYTGSSDFTINFGDCFNINRQIGYSGLKNHIIVPYSPLVPEDENSDIYTTNDITVGAGDSSVTETIEVNDVLYVTGSESPNAEVYDEDGVTMSITSETYTPYSAVIVASKDSGTSGTFKIRINGKRLINQEVIEITDSDEESISLYKKREYKFEQNHLIQNLVIAQAIATAALKTLKDPKRDISVEVQGNPATEIGDIADIEVYSKDDTYDEFRTMRQQYKFNSNGLRLQLTGRKTIDYGA